MNKTSALIYKTYYPEMMEGLAEKAKYISNFGYDTGATNKPSITDKPIYQEVNKIPVSEQVDLINKQRMLNNLMLKQHPELGLPPSQDELKRQYLEQLYLEQFPKNAELT